MGVDFSQSAGAGIGLDFGTTNSSLAVADADGGIQIAEFPTRGDPVSSFRSVLFFGREDSDAPVESASGPEAIERYLQLEGERRLMQSLKSFLASRLFKATNLFGRITTLEDLVGKILRDVRTRGDTRLPEGCPLVVGRPVRFAKSDGPEDDTFAVSRLNDALTRAGFAAAEFEFEPVAAAHHYEQQLDEDELVLIADFGGGTSDFCLLRVGPGLRGRARREDDILGTAGVALAGDAFDAKLVRHLVAPRLGKGQRHDSLFGRDLPVPLWIYADLERWHHLSFLRSRKTMGMLRDVRAGAANPEPIEALIHLVEADLGFALYRAVEKTKAELSQSTRSTLRFEAPPVLIEADVTRTEFDSWIAEELAKISECVERVLSETSTPTERVDRVFLTGGSAFVPAVRHLFEERFGADRIRGGEELVSVARGLALCARDRAAARR